MIIFVSYIFIFFYFIKGKIMFRKSKVLIVFFVLKESLIYLMGEVWCRLCDYIWIYFSYRNFFSRI